MTERQSKLLILKYLRCYIVSVANNALLQCKMFGLKIRYYNSLEKYHVCGGGGGSFDLLNSMQWSQTNLLVQGAELIFLYLSYLI